MSPPRVLIAIEPHMYAEVLAFSTACQRPHAEVSILDPSEDLKNATLRLSPHLVVANRPPSAIEEGAKDAFWVEIAKPQADRGVEPLGARISANGSSKSVEEVCIADVLEALDRAEEELVPGVPPGAPA